MTQEVETARQPVTPATRVTPTFTVIVEKTEFVSRDSGSKSIAGTLGNGKPTHLFKIMTNKTFPGSLKHVPGTSLQDTGVVMLLVHQLKEDGTPGEMVLAWEKGSTTPAQGTPEAEELKTAIISDIFAKFRGTELGPDQKQQSSAENIQPIPVP